MSRYVKKHRSQIFGIAMPTLILFILVVIGFSVSPGWIKDAYTTPGDPCTTLTDCDICNMESCNTSSFCENVFGSTSPTATPTPACPEFLIFGTLDQPRCWTECTVVNFEPECSPSDQFCIDIDGGTQSNACRDATCTAVETPDPANISGCDYTFDSGDPTCINCESPLPTGVTNCGNGVCEKPDEDVSNCSVDCRVPGFTDSENAPDVGCQLPNITFVTFNGPPFNDPILNFGNCEDGDICTDNECMGGVLQAAFCQITDKACDATTADFCCPSGCTPATDVDCLDPEDCSIPSPTPVVSANVQGSGEVFGCALKKENPVPLTAAKYLILLAGIMATALFLKRRFS